MTKLRLGTRRSLLALAQSGGVARQLESLHPGLEVELVGIETRGDQITDIPLSQVEGKEFFVAELDKALVSGQVDLTVHSLKDLSLERPQEICLAAVPARSFAHDVFLLSAEGYKKTIQGKDLRVGTSSPRRKENIPPFLADHLPGGGQITWVDLRGNVNTRLQRLHEESSSERYLDGIVLALAGLERLWADEEARKKLAPLLDGIKMMVLPLAANPTAPAQGALAIECRGDDQKTRDLLKGLHDPATLSQIEKERKYLRQWGGGCHLALGATCWNEDVLYLRGRKPSGEFEESTEWNRPERGAETVRAWDGTEWKEAQEEFEIDSSLCPELVLVTHGQAVNEHWMKYLCDHPSIMVYAAGEKTWSQLTKNGIWVQGCGDAGGASDLLKLFQAQVLQLPPKEKWLVLTHQGGLEKWRDLQIPVQATYENKSDLSAKGMSQLKVATNLYWGSATQMKKYLQYCQTDVHHAAGMGSTGDELVKLATEGRIKKFDLFPTRASWRQWLEY